MYRTLAVLLALAGLCTTAPAAEEIVTLKTRDDVTQSYLLTPGADAAPRFVAILFSGGAGTLNLRPRADGSLVGSSNFLIRARDLFAGSGIATAAVDTPSDMRSMNDAFRMSDKHTNDIRLVVEDLRRRFPQAKLFLVGTSRGTVSAAYAAAALAGGIDGVVLTSTVFNATKSNSGVAGFDFAKIRAPLLFVHHREDACSACPYSGAARLADRFPLISVSGGQPPQSDPCEPLSAHGYFGKEAETVAAIGQWMTGKPHPAEVK
jgi:pimeloyl-ACP methyl ester carboxylesterase